MSLKEIKGRILSIQSTQKITSAMHMVASAKLHRTQAVTQNFLVYVNALKGIVNDLGLDISDSNAEQDVHDRKVVLIPISSNSGLCGAFNTNIVKAAIKRADELTSKGADITFIPIGRKIVHELGKTDYTADTSFHKISETAGISGTDAFGKAASLAVHLKTLHESGDIDAVEFIYHHFKSMGQQVVTFKSLNFSPLKSKEETDGSTPANETADTAKRPLQYLTEPSAGELFKTLYPKLLNVETYSIILDSITSEHAARMLAMQTADDNANELLNELTLLYNKSRQQAITNELIDIMGGKTI